jgi:drug/metabolite transporter (DMT)-like permease
MLNHIPEMWRGYALATLAMLSFTIGVLGTKLGLNASEANFYSLAIWGWGIGMLVATLIFYAPLKTQRENLVPELKQHLKFISLIAVLTVINGAAWFYGMSQINGGVVALLDQNVIVWSFLLGALFLGERFSWRQLCAIAITIIGLAIISNLKGEVTPLGVLSLLTCGLSIATQSLVIKKYGIAFNTMALTFWRGWSMVLCSLGIALTLGVFNWHIEPIALIAIGVAQFFGLFVGRAAYIKAHEYLPMSHLSFLMLGIPVIVLLSSFVVLGEPVSLQKIIGALVMLSGLIWFFTRKAKRAQVKKTGLKV